MPTSGGYSERPDRRGYSFEHWHLADTFIYFAHHRISLPPVGWVEAANRHGTKIIGTLIFEWSESIPSLSHLLRGPSRSRLPHRGPASFSPYYADLLISLALACGFTGWLINVEVGLNLGFSCSGEAWPPWIGEAARRNEMKRNADRLRSWVEYLRREGERRCPDWQVIWYDSVTANGDLAWQDALTPHNAPFLQVASSIFTNYTWAKPPVQLPPGMLKEALQPHQQRQLEGYGLTGPHDGGFHPALQISAAMADYIGRKRHDVLVGIDVFGRNCYGGMESWKSLDMIASRRLSSQASGSPLPASSLGLSVALFAPGWTWEHDEPKRDPLKGRSWAHWFEEDCRFWIGSPSSPHPSTSLVPASTAATPPPPISSFFPPLTQRPDRLARMARPAYYTNFGLGSGVRWFVAGRCVYDWSKTEGGSSSDLAVEADQNENDKLLGWADQGVSMPKPDLLYHAATEPGTSVSWSLNEQFAWSGNVSLQLTLGQAAWEVPISTVALSAIPRQDGVLRACVHYRFLDLDGAGSTRGEKDGMTDEGNEARPRLLTAEGSVLEEVEASRHTSSVGGGWRRAETSFRLAPTRTETDGLLVLRLHLQGRGTGALLLGSVEVGPPPSSSGSSAAPDVGEPSTALVDPTCTCTLVQRPRDGAGGSKVTFRLAWNDFDPATPYYQVFAAAAAAADGETHAQQQSDEVWIGTATREARRTEAAFVDLDLERLGLAAAAAAAAKGAAVEMRVRSMLDSCQVFARCAFPPSE
ncbi:uncharacterized protein PSFLO_03128 [Pseudozyma flocculosa]|uniref:Cytosolic endo-beta-N-acetylglucosaminidase TIM barrel domain-containing protein n=1 Tax=Pseudozyma flocculosa TaxID=84751 RepID=A0A5C3F008_9BASI|nr:uncharacterized protein PSFLO_03128 [Pseudozyma flocculosa]